MGQAVAAYDTAVHRLILMLTNAGDLEQTGETWAFDPAEGTWEQGAPVPNTLPGGYPAGWAAAFDPQREDRALRGHRRAGLRRGRGHLDHRRSWPRLADGLHGRRGGC